MENGNSEDEILSILQREGRDAVDIYIGSKIDNDKLNSMFGDVMSKENK